MAHELHRAVAHASVARIGSAICGAGAHLLAIRVLGASSYGEFVLAESAVVALSIATLFGTHVSAFGLIGERRGASVATGLKAGTILIASLTLALALLLLMLRAFIPESALSIQNWMAPVLLGVLGMSLYRFLSELLRIGVGVGLANYFSGRGNGFISSAAFATLLAACNLSGNAPKSPVDLMLLLAIGQWLGVIAALAILLPRLRGTAPQPGTVPRTLREFGHRGPLISLTQGLQIAQANVDLWILAALGNPAALGIYGLGKRFALWLVAPTGLVALSAKKRAVDEYLSVGRISRELETAFRHAALRSWFGVVALVMGAAVVPASWLQAIAGPHAADSRWFFVGLGAGQILRLLFGNGGLILGAAGHEHDNLRAHLWGLAVAALVCAASIPFIDAWGATAGYSLGMIVSAVLISRACERQMGFACDLVRSSHVRVSGIG
jgi:O-antigen/teichoic acid export membrane protein